MRPLSVAAYACVICLLPGMASAQATVTPELPAFESVDTDRDGSVSRDELSAVRNELFAWFDGNDDGVVSTDEVVAVQEMIELRSQLRQTRLALAAARLDADRDGTITLAEFEAMPDFFILMDADEDGLIGREEAERVRDLIVELIR